MTSASTIAAASPPPLGAVAEPTSFEGVYDRYFPLVFRNIRRLGVPDAQVDDAVQEVFLVVHRRMAEVSVSSRPTLKPWICAIVARTASDARRAIRRKSPHARGDAAVDADTVADDRTASPHDSLVRSEGVQLLHRLLDQLDDDKRTVIVLAELEQMSVPEISEALGENVNTIYARLRAARREFDEAARQARARDTWRLR